MDIGKHGVLLMRADAKPWQMEGNSGTAYSVRFMNEGKVFRARITEALFKEVKDLQQVDAIVSLSLDAYNERLRLQCDAVEVA